MREIRPNFRTDPKDYSEVEIAKLKSDELRNDLYNEFRDRSRDNLSWEAEQVAKSHGIYLEFNRARTGNRKDWMYMVRISIPGGGSITKEQWKILDTVADRYTAGPEGTYPAGRPSLRVTTRQNIQLHWVRKQDLVRAVSEVAKSGFFTINGCGDNTRNVIGCPLSHRSPIFDANEWARRAGKYFALPTAAYIEVFEVDPGYLRKAGLADREPGKTRFAYDPNQLNRKFKIGFSAIHYDHENNRYVPDNCIELRTNDIGVAPIVDDGRVERFQVYIGGSQGQQSGKPTFSALGEPFGIFTAENLMKGLDRVVQVHQEWGDRQNRHWARLKYVVRLKGIEWFREQVRKLDDKLEFGPPVPDLDYGGRNLHLGWTRQPDGELWCYGAFIENGRIVDGGPNGDLKSMVTYLMDNYSGIELFTTPNQHLLFANIADGDRDRFEKDMQRFGYGYRRNDGASRKYSKLRMLSGACVGRDTCRLTYTDSEKFEPYLIDELEKKWGDIAESVGVTGCEKQCYRPATKTIGWIGTGLNLYQLTLFGTEDARHQGGPLVDPDTNEEYLRFVPRKDVPRVTDALFEYYVRNRSEEETRLGGMGYFLRRIGAKTIISYLKSNPATADLMKKTFKTS